MSVHPVRAIVKRACHESAWLVVVYVESEDPSAAQPMDHETMANTLERLLPYTPAMERNTYGWPWASKTPVPCVTTKSLRHGTLVYNPQNKNVAEYNQRASDLTSVEVYGLAVIICPTEEDAAEAVEDVNGSAVDLGWWDKVFTIGGRVLWRRVGRKP